MSKGGCDLVARHEQQIVRLARGEGEWHSVIGDTSKEALFVREILELFHTQPQRGTERN